MEPLYAGLDVSDKKTNICIVKKDGKAHWQGVCASDPDALSRSLKKRAPGLVSVVLETGPISSFLYHGLQVRGIDAVCICARHAKGVLSTRLNKSDENDAEGLAQLARTGWYKAVHVKGQSTHLDRTLLRVRHQLVKSHVDMLNQLRSLLKLFGLRLGAVTTPDKRSERLTHLFEREPTLKPLLDPLINALSGIEFELKKLAKQVKRQAAGDLVCKRLMTVPGVGPITALTFKSSIEDPARFKRACDVGAYAGLTPRRFQSGDMDTMGHISKRGDKMLRRALYEAANSILGRLKRDCALKAWGRKLAEHKGAKPARVAVARKLAMLMHRIWVTGEEFDWQKV